MTKPAAFFGSYVDAKFMRGLKVTRVMIDIPIESTNAFLTAFGAPDGVNPVPVAIARLVSAPSGAEGNGPDRTGPTSSGTPDIAAAKEQDKPRTYTRSQLAAILCSDFDFRQWLIKQNTDEWAYITTNMPDHADATEMADALLKLVLCIKSKKELDLEGPEALAFDKIKATYDYRDQVRR